MPRLLLIEADPYLQRTLQTLFAAEEYFCGVAGDADQARRMLLGDPFDAVVLDLGRLRSEGLTLLRQIRTRHHMPILVLAPDGDVMDTVVGLEVGADDYICEPFDPRELVGRVRAQLRRGDEYSRPVELRNRIDLGEVVLDLDRRDAFREGEALALTTREFELLHLFARYRDKALATEWTFENVWGYAADLGIKALTVYVGRLRRKIETDAGHPRLLISIRGFGYKLVTAGE